MSDSLSLALLPPLCHRVAQLTHSGVDACPSFGSGKVYSQIFSDCTQQGLYLERDTSISHTLCVYVKPYGPIKLVTIRAQVAELNHLLLSPASEWLLRVGSAKSSTSRSRLYSAFEACAVPFLMIDISYSNGSVGEGDDFRGGAQVEDNEGEAIQMRRGRRS